MENKDDVPMMSDENEQATPQCGRKIRGDQRPHRAAGNWWNLLHIQSVYVLITITIALLPAIVLATGTCDVNSVTDTSPHKKTRDPFNVSFKATLVIPSSNSKGRVKTFLDVEWNAEYKNISFQKTSEYRQSDQNSVKEFSTRVIIAGNKSAIGISYKDENTFYCYQHLKHSLWLSVFHLILTMPSAFDPIKTESGSNGTSYRWQGSEMYTPLEYFIEGQKLVYIKYDDEQANVTDWSITKERTIFVPDNTENGPCEEFQPSTPPSVYQDFMVFDHSSAFKKYKIQEKQTNERTKTCLFIHGAGEIPSGDWNLTSLPSYWGKIEKYTPSCASHRFIHYDSVNNAWDDERLQGRICEFAATNGIIQDKVIFTHSMGNLVLAADLHMQKCKFDQSTSRWYSIQGPWKGSREADKLIHICKSKKAFDEILRFILHELHYNHYCNSTTLQAMPAYESLTHTYMRSGKNGIDFESLIQTADSLISGAMCGTSALGLWWKDELHSLALIAIQKNAGLEKPNDGMVAFESCSIKGEFEKDWKNKFYKGDFNHEQGTCRFGKVSDWVRILHKFPDPCLWFSEMHR